MKVIRRWGWVLPAVIVVGMAGFVIWASLAAAPMPAALEALQSDADVRVESEPWLIFWPAAGDPKTGLILYPGGRVDARAYAPLAREIASGGHLVVIVPMPLNLAVLAPGRAERVMEAYPQIVFWAVGGHSLGGAMAANFAYTHPRETDGLALWAAYPAEGNSLYGLDLAAVSISATLDGLATPAKIEATRHLLPADTDWVVIEGGNHAGFGSYGEQAGDLPAQISRAEQQRQVVQATLALLERLWVE
jgi:hypothetical protein